MGQARTRLLLFQVPLLAVLFVSACLPPPAKQETYNGRWHAWLDSPGGPLPFSLELWIQAAKPRAVLVKELREYAGIVSITAVPGDRKLAIAGDRDGRGCLRPGACSVYHKRVAKRPALCVITPSDHAVIVAVAFGVEPAIDDCLPGSLTTISDPSRVPSAANRCIRMPAGR